MLFKKGINTIIGENGSGKTNLFYALRILLDDTLPRYINLYSSDFNRALRNWAGHWIIISISFDELDASEEAQALAVRSSGHMDTEKQGSYAILADFFLENDKHGFYFGPSIFLYNKSVELSSVNERTKFFTLYPNIRAGYVWYPFKNINLYLNPWLNFGTEINLDNKNELNGTTFIPNKFYYIAAVHMGYSLSW